MFSPSLHEKGRGKYYIGLNTLLFFHADHKFYVRTTRKKKILSVLFTDAIILISSDLGLQQLGTGLGFPARDWAGSWRRKPKILATRSVVSGKGPSWPLGFTEKNSHKDGKE